MTKQPTFGEWLRRMRSDRRMGIAVTATRLFMSSGTLSFMEQGKSGANDSHIARMAVYFKTDESAIRRMSGVDLPVNHGNYCRLRRLKAKEERKRTMPRKPIDTFHVSDLQGLSPEKFIGVANKILSDDRTWYLGTRSR